MREWRSTQYGSFECEYFIDLMDVNVDDNSIDIEEVKVAGEYSRTVSFRKKMRGLSPHRLPLKKRIKYRPISNVDLLRQIGNEKKFTGIKIAFIKCAVLNVPYTPVPE